MSIVDQFLSVLKKCFGDEYSNRFVLFQYFYRICFSAHFLAAACILIMLMLESSRYMGQDDDICYRA